MPLGNEIIYYKNFNKYLLFFKLTKFLQQNKSLENLCNIISQNFGTVLIGAEIEFYLSNDIDIKEFQKKLEYKIIKERAEMQYEIILPPENNLIQLINKISVAIEQVQKISKNFNTDTLFTPKPFLDNYGNGLHFHINIIDSNRKNLFDNEKILLKYADVLCHYMKLTFFSFAPEKKYYARFKKGYLAPTHISYGKDNRTTSLRIVTKFPKRIEHRLSSPSLDPYLGLYVIIKCLYISLQSPPLINKLYNVYGNAFDSQYNLEPLPANLKIAYSNFDLSFFGFKKAINFIFK